MTHSSARWFHSLMMPFLYLVFTLAGSLANATTVYNLTIDSAVGPASHDFLETGIRNAIAYEAGVILVELDTPGGLVTSMREMATSILNSPIPVIVYVSPSGAQAASAGAFLVYAAHIAAMAPGTNIGAALPVSLVGEDKNLPSDEPPKPPIGVAETTGEVKATAEKGRSYSDVKILEDLSAFMRSLAQKSGRNEALGIAMVTRGRSFTADEALKENIVNVVSPTLGDLLTQVNGMTVTVLGKKITLDTSTTTIIKIMPNWRNGFLSILTDPNITYILLLIGMYGVLLEFYSPGSLYPGVIGGICIILAGYSLHLLPVSYAGLGLLILGIIFLIFESVTPSYGIFGVGGIIAFIVGSIFLLDTELPGYNIAPSLILTMSVVTLGFFMTLMRFIIGALTAPAVSGPESFIGRKALVIETFIGYGSVRVNGYIYRAHSDKKLYTNTLAEVYDVRGITLYVRPEKPKRKHST